MVLELHDEPATKADFARLERTLDRCQASIRRYIVAFVFIDIAALYLMLHFAPK